MPDLAGRNFGNYHLIRLLGRGGFAEVYLGEHVHLQSQAAIKVLNLVLTDERKENFLIEARRLVQLRHPHIVRLMEFGIEDDIPFLVMEYAPNGSLRKRHPKGSQVSLDMVVAYVKQVADALQYIHEQKLVHRDIKPENMLLGLNNEVMLCDLGIAVEAHSTGTMVPLGQAGTAPYMAPEQIIQKPRPASDQYALGIVVYEWLCGTRPFDGALSNIAYQHLHVPPPALSERLPVISRTVEEVVLTALAKDPKQRFPSVQAFAEALEVAARYSKQPLSIPLLSEQAAYPASTLPPNTSSTQPSIAGSSSQQEAPIQSNRLLNEPPLSTISASLQSTPTDLLETPSFPDQASLSHQGSDSVQQIARQIWSQGTVRGTNRRSFAGNISLIIILIVLILGGVVSYIILEQTGKDNPVTAHQSGTADTQTSSRTQTPLITSTVQPVRLPSPLFDSFTLTEIPNGTIYTVTSHLAANVTDKNGQPIRADNLTCKLWLIADVPNDQGVYISPDIANNLTSVNGPFTVQGTALSNFQPLPGVTYPEIQQGLIFDGATPQTHNCSTYGGVTWRYQISPSINPGKYTLVVLYDWSGIHYNYGWIHIIITKAG